MGTYNNPATMFGNNSQMIPGQPIAGALAGIQNAYSMKNADQAIRDSDLSFMEQMHKFEQDQLDDPSRAAKREAGIAEAGTATDWNKSGGALSQLNATLGKTQIDNEKNKQEIEKTAIEMKGEFLARLADQQKSAPSTENGAEELIKWWGEKKVEAKKIGLDLGPQSAPNAEMWAQIAAAGAAHNNQNKAGQRIREINAQADANARPDQASSLSGQAFLHAIDRGGREDVADIKAKSLKDIADMRAEQQARNQTDLNQMTAWVGKMVKDDMKQYGKLSPETEKAAIAMAEKSADLALEHDPMYLAKKSSPNPENQAAAKNMRTDKMMQYLGTVPGFNEAAMKTSGKTVTKPPTEDKAAKVLEILKANPKNAGKTDKQLLDAAKAAGKL